MRFKKKLLCCVVGSIASAGMSSVYAQDIQEEEVVVTGIRASLMQALDMKREANASVEAISAEDIGKFPDKNIAESLQRVPGVTINRGFTGEGNEVSIRGVNPELTNVLLNGQFVASTGWFSQTANKRAFNMDMMPSEMVANVEVYKSPVATLDEGGVGGTVVVHTRKPLDLDPMTVFASVEAMQNTIGDSDTALSGTAMLSWKDASERFGLLAMVSSVETLGRAHKADNYWEEGWSASGIAEFNQDRVRDGIDLTGQFQATDNLLLELHYFKSELDAANTNQNFLAINSHWRDGITSVVTPAAGAEVAPNGLPLAGTVTEGVAWLAQDINSRQAVME